MLYFAAGRAVLGVAFCLLLLSLFCSPAFSASGDPAASDEAFRKELERTLREHPEIVLDILKENSESVLEIAQQGSILRKRKASLAQWESDAQQPKKVNLEGRSFRGAANTPVTIVAYSDFTCPYCRQAEVTIQQLLQKYPTEIRVSFKALPKDDNALSQAAAKFSTAAFLLDPVKGWEFFDIVFDEIEQFERDGEAFVKAAATRVGLDFKKLKSEVGSARVKDRLDADRAEADRLDITGTPYFLVNDLLVRGAVSKDLFEEAIEMALSLKKSSKSERK